MENKTDVFIIKCRTNMHVGSGEETFGLIENCIQRDIITNHSQLNSFSLPVINSSSLKGALREYFTFKENKHEDFLNEVFGSDNRKKNGDKRINKTGKVKFFNANIFSFPVRSNKRPYFNTTCPWIIEEFLKNCKFFEYELPKELENLLIQLKELEPKEGKILISEDIKELIFEDDELEGRYINNLNINHLKKFIGNSPAIINNEKFIELCDDSNLPLIARNRLENGISKNLWHEQVIPRETRFLFFVMNQSSKNILEFPKNSIVQIGANGSIGYGYCEISNIIHLMNFNKEKI